jgi:antitoxin component YwqK of YwqJK toxin-antitoxin module
MKEYNILPTEKVINEGIEFDGEIVCYSGEYGDRVCESSLNDGDKPIYGLIYEKHKNGNLAYYCFYENGIENGDYVKFYEDGSLQSFCVMKKGSVTGECVEWHANGKIKSIADFKYGVQITYRQWNENGDLIEEKIEPNAFEKELIEKYDALEKE